MIGISLLAISNDEKNKEYLIENLLKHIIKLIVNSDDEIVIPFGIYLFLLYYIVYLPVYISICQFI
jgi:hypothetical protein